MHIDAFPQAAAHLASAFAPQTTDHLASALAPGSVDYGPIIVTGIGAVASIVAAILVAWTAIRSTSYKQLLEDIRAIVEDKLADEKRGPAIASYVVQAIREALGTHTRYRRRWYDP